MCVVGTKACDGSAPVSGEGSLIRKPAPIGLAAGRLQAALFTGVESYVLSGWCVLSISCAMSIARPWCQTYSHAVVRTTPLTASASWGDHVIDWYHGDARYGDTSTFQTCKSPSLHFLVYEMGSTPSTSRSHAADSLAGWGVAAARALLPLASWSDTGGSTAHAWRRRRCARLRWRGNHHR